MTLKAKLTLFLLFIVGTLLTLFFVYPRAISIMFSYKKTCRVLRVEQFLKGFALADKEQKNKFSIICDDGTVCRAEDTGFAAVKEGDEVEFRGFPEFGRIEEFGKCDHAQLIRIVPKAQ